MTERHWVDADEVLEEAAREEEATHDAADDPGAVRGSSRLDRHLDEAGAAELVEEGHQAGD